MVVSAAYFLIGATLGSMGPISGEVRHELHLSGTVTGLHGSMFGWSLLTFGLAAHWLLRTVGAVRLFEAGLVTVMLGVVVLGTGHHVAITLAGAALIGVGAASLVLVMPPLLNHHHAEGDRVRALTFANGISVLGNLGALAAIAASLRLGWGWRWTMVVIGLAVGGPTLVAGARRHLRQGHDRDSGAPDHAARLLLTHPTVRARWLVLALGISVEFAVLLWGSSALQELGHARPAVGALAIGLFSGGMALGRFMGPRWLRVQKRRDVLRGSFGLAFAASFALRYGPGLPGRIGGLLVLGLAVALMYPVGFSRLYVDDLPSSSAGAVGALASGTAVTFAPLALGALADLAGLGSALFIIPALALAGLVLVTQQPDDRPLGG